MRRVDGDAHQCVISASLVMADFANVKATLFGQEWRVDHVHRVGKTPHETGENRRSNRLDIQFRRSALNLNSNIVQIIVRQLANQRTQF